MRTIHINHLGFRPDDPMKRALMPLPPGSGMGFLGAHLFNVTDISRLVREPLNAPAWLNSLHIHHAAIEDTPLGRYAVCDFSDLREHGGYQLQFDEARSYPFLIYRDSWKRLFRILLEWYRNAACGEAVPGYHDICHLDDCRLAETGAQVDLVGGWHDAGDLRKWTSTMSYVTLALADFLEEAPADLSAWGVDADLVLHQLTRGAEYLLKMIDPQSNLVWHSIASDVNSGNESGVWTDNIPNSGDERGAKQDCQLGTADVHVQALAAVTRILGPRHPALAGRTGRAALRIWDALRPQLLAKGGTDQLVDSATRLWSLTERAEFADCAVAGLREILARQEARAAFGQDRLRGYFVKDGTIEGNDTFHGRGGRSLFRHLAHARRLCDALRFWPEHADSARWRDGLSLLLEGCVEPMLRLHPYRALPACLCTEADGAAGARPLAGQLRFRYFGVEAEGNNNDLATAAGTLGLAARLLGQPKWAAYGQKQCEWILGFNPEDECMLTGVGYRRHAVFSPYVGPIPGAIINGFTGTRDTDEPVLCTQREMSPMNMEYWSVHTASLLRALAVLENEPLS